MAADATDSRKHHLILEKIHNILYLEDSKYDPDKEWDAETTEAIAEAMLEYKPRPNKTQPEGTNAKKVDHEVECEYCGEVFYDGDEAYIEERLGRPIAYYCYDCGIDEAERQTKADAPGVWPDWIKEKPEEKAVLAAKTKVVSAVTIKTREYHGVEITPFCNGRGPEDFGWVIDGRTVTCYDLNEAIRGKWKGVSELLGEELTGHLKKNCPQLDYLSTWFQDNFV